VTVVGCFEFGWWDVAAVFVQAAVVVPVDPFQHGDLDLLGGPPRAAALEQFGLEQPIVVSASALSYASPTEPTEGSAPAAARRSVQASETYCALASK
jgi:hypothetical protein